MVVYGEMIITFFKIKKKLKKCNYILPHELSTMTLDPIKLQFYDTFPISSVKIVKINGDLHVSF
jgi:hypothetical protein